MSNLEIIKKEIGPGIILITESEMLDFIGFAPSNFLMRNFCDYSCDHYLKIRVKMVKFYKTELLKFFIYKCLRYILLKLLYINIFIKKEG